MARFLSVKYTRKSGYEIRFDFFGKVLLEQYVFKEKPITK